MLRNPKIRTCDLWLWKSIGFERLSRYMFLQNFIKLSAAVHELTCVHRKKNSDENNTVRRYRTNSKNVRSVSTHLRLVRAFGVLGKFAVVVKDERNVVLGRRTTCRRAADIATTTTTTTCQTTASTAGARHTTTASTSSGQWPNGWVGIVDIQRRRLALEPNVVSVLATT